MSIGKAASPTLMFWPAFPLEWPPRLASEAMGGLMRLTGLALLATVTLSFLAAPGAAIAQQAAKGVPQLGSVSWSSGTPLVPSP